MRDHWKFLVLFIAVPAGCDSRQPCASEPLSRPQNYSEGQATSAHERHYSRGRTAESGQFGSIALVDVGDDTQSLSSSLRDELSLSERQHERCVFVTIVPGCPSCAALGYAIASGTLERLTGKLRVVRIDLDEFESDVRALSLPIDRVPGFFLVDAAGQVRDFLDASEWDTNDPAKFAPIIAKFLDGRLEQRRRPWIPEIESRAIDL